MRVGIRRLIQTVMVWALCLTPAAARAAQTSIDQADPSVIEEQLRQDERARPRPRPPVVIKRPQGPQTQVGEAVVAGAIRIEGARMLAPPLFARAIEPYVGRMLTPADLQALASAVADVARDAGFGLATAWVPQQRVVNGVLSVMLDEGRIDEIEIEGSAQVVRRALAPLADGRPVRTSDLERRLLLAGDIAGVRVGKARLERRGGRSTLVVRAVYERIAARAYLDNWGTAAVGPLRARLTVDFNGLLAGDDQLTVGGVTTPLEPQEFGLVRVAYTKPIGSNGTELGVGGYVAKSKPGGALSGRDIEGQSAEIEASVRHPLVRGRSSSLWTGLDFRVRDASQTVNDVKVRDDRLAILGANVFAGQQVGRGRLRGRLEVSKGFDLFDATLAGDPLASRRDASGTFSKLEAWMDYTQKLGSKFSLLLQAEGQIADRPLLSSEEMGLGGRSFGRAWDYREFSGDRGIAGAAELRFDFDQLPRPFSFLQLYAFADAGKVANDRAGFGDGSLVSAGGGVRLWLLKGFEAGVEVAVPLTSDADSSDGDEPRWSLSLGSRF